jgi:CubicO group peptidase (beta-lactamase class C family)
LAAGCNQTDATPLSPSPSDTQLADTSAAISRTPGPENADRKLLTFDQLMSGFDAPSPIDEYALTFPENTTTALHNFEGRLELRGEATVGEMIVLKGDPNQLKEVSHLPEFNFEFVQSGDGYFIPVQRGLIITEHPYWDYILEPGRVWQENDDQGYSRASFPFALVWKSSNATLNGTMTFLFNDDSISKVWYQVTQETTISFGADMWGLLEASYHPELVDNSTGIRDAFAEEIAGRFPTKNIKQLAVDYPGIDIFAFGRGVYEKNMTWFGFVLNGINYVGGCQTRYGLYPYCESMRAPSYSTAKSAFVSMALMRLAQKYDPDLPNFLIKDYVPEASESPGDWSSVTFDNTLDMATGNYRSSNFLVDEESWDTDPFWSEDYFDEIITAAFNWQNSAPPGTRWVYRTSDTFILTSALQNYLNTVEGADVDIFEFTVDEIYKPLKMAPGVFTTLRTRDNNGQGQPYGGLGMWWIPDDLAKIGNFLNIDGGAIGGEQILQPDILAASLQRDPNDRGVENYPGGRYNNAFWADSYGTSDGYDCEFWVAEMQGYSGIVVVLMPNGTIYYYASDGREFTWDAAVRESNKIIPYCP